MAALNACDRVLSGGRVLSMREHLAALAGLGYDLDAPPDVYGDGVVRELEERVGGLLGKPAAAFFPPGRWRNRSAFAAGRPAPGTRW